ncbi:MAG: PhoU domain-containing protein, partial [bacterium]
KWIESTDFFSPEGEKEIKDFHALIMRQYHKVLEVFEDLNLEKAKEVKNKSKKYEKFVIDLEKHHFSRLLHENSKAESSSKTHLEIMGMLNAVNRHISNMARFFLKDNNTGDLESA